MSENLVLDIATREVTGKKVKALRREGYIPGVIYGPLSEEPIAVQVEWTVLRPVLQEAGGTSLISLNVDGKIVQVLVRTVQRHPVRRDVLHVDFYAVDVNMPIKTRIPVVIPNREAAAKRLGARIFQPMNTIDIESLPADIPSEIAVDLSVLKKVGDNLTVSELPALKGVTYLADDDAVVIRTVSLVSLEAEEEGEEGEEETFSDESGISEPEVISHGKREEEEF